MNEETTDVENSGISTKLTRHSLDDNVLETRCSRAERATSCPTSRWIYQTSNEKSVVGLVKRVRKQAFARYLRQMINPVNTSRIEELTERIIKRTKGRRGRSGGEGNATIKIIITDNTELQVHYARLTAKLLLVFHISRSLRVADTQREIRRMLVQEGLYVGEHWMTGLLCRAMPED